MYVCRYNTNKLFHLTNHCRVGTRQKLKSGACYLLRVYYRYNQPSVGNFNRFIPCFTINNQHRDKVKSIEAHLS